MSSKCLLCLLLASFLCLLNSSASLAEPYKGFESGDVLIRLRGLAVLPDVDGSVSNINGHTDASNSYDPEIDFTYFFTPNVSVEAIAAITRHNMFDHNSSVGDVNLGKVSLLPPTVTLQYHFMPDSNFSPYVGAGVNYTAFFDVEMANGSAATSIHYDNTFAPVLQAGIDYHLAGHWYLNLDVKHIFLTTKVNINHGAFVGDSDLNPTIVGFGFGYKL